MKEHMALVQLYKDGFVKGGPDKFEIKLDKSSMTKQYGASAKLFYIALTRLLDGLKKSGFSVQTQNFRSKVGKIGLPYAEDGLSTDAVSFQVEDLIGKRFSDIPTVYICEKVRI